MTITLRKTRSSAARAAGSARDVIEDVLLNVRKLPRSVDRPRIVSAMEAALNALHHLAQSKLRDPDHLDRVAVAQRHVKLARERVAAHDHTSAVDSLVAQLRSVEHALEIARERTIDAVVRDQQDALAEGSKPKPPAQPRAFKTSDGAPAAYSWERAPLRLQAEVKAPDAAVFDEDADAHVLADAANTTNESYLTPVAFEEDDKPLIDGPDVVRRLEVLGSRHFEHAVMAPGLEGETAQLRRLARDCMEEMGGLWTLRQRRPDERFMWDATLAQESRLLRSLDALMALGRPATASAVGEHLQLSILDEVLGWSQDGPVVDAHRAFTRAFVLGNVEGDDTARASIAALKQSHRATHNAQRDAMTLSTNSAMIDAAKRLSRDDDPRFVAMALDVLLARDAGNIAEAAVLLDHPAPDVRARAAALMGWAPPERAVAALSEHIENETDDDVSLACAEALARLGSDIGLLFAREALTDELDEPDSLFPPHRARLMQLLAIAGNADDAVLLATHFDASEEHCLALGFHGHIGHIETMLEALEPEIRYAAGPRGRRFVAEALVRITGAPHWEKRHGSVTDQYAVRIDYELWQSWWTENKSRFSMGQRYRFGEPYSGTQTTKELARPEVPLSIRRMLALELNALLDERALYTGDFASRQRDQLRSAHDRVEQAAADEGLPRLGKDGWLALSAKV